MKCRDITTGCHHGIGFLEKCSNFICRSPENGHVLRLFKTVLSAHSIENCSNNNAFQFNAYRPLVTIWHGGLCPGGGSLSRERILPMDRRTNASKNVTLPQTSFAGGKNYRKLSDRKCGYHPYTCYIANRPKYFSWTFLGVLV